MYKKGIASSMFFPLIIIGLLLSGFFYFYIPWAKEKAISRGEVCGDFTSIDGSKYNCCKDCKKLNLEYFRYEYSGSMFGASISNCYCKEDNNIKQIW